MSESRCGLFAATPIFFEHGDMQISLIVIQYIANIYKDLNSHIVVGKSILAIPYKPLETRSMCFEKQDWYKNLVGSAPQNEQQV